MTETEWLACEDGRAMLRHLRGKTTARKLRLFAVACHRWHAQSTRKLLRVLEVLNAAEEMADGKRNTGVKQSGWLLLGSKAYDVAVTTSTILVSPRGGKGIVSLSTQASLLHCIVGNPFRPITMSPTWQTSSIRPIAQAAYAERAMPAGHLDPARLAVLSDALEEAGCTEADVLEHLRSPGPHVRGCWALDLVMGKK